MTGSSTCVYNWRSETRRGCWRARGGGAGAAMGRPESGRRLPHSKTLRTMLGRRVDLALEFQGQPDAGLPGDWTGLTIGCLERVRDQHSDIALQT